MKRAIVGLCLLWASCGGTPAPPAHTPVQDEPAPGAARPEQPLEQPVNEAPSAEPPSGPAKLTVVAKVGGTAVPAQLKVLGEDGQVVAEGPTGTPLTVQSGELTIEVKIKDAKVLADLPTTQRNVTLAAGQDLTETVVIERCLLRISVNIKGKVDKTAVVTLNRNGADVAKVVSGAREYVPLSSGRYGVKVTSKRAEVTVSEIALQEGATQDIPINVN